MRDNKTSLRENKRQSLIDAAVRLIVEKGDPRSVSTRAIVSMADTSKSAIDYHFGNKAGLISAVFEELRKMHTGECLSAYYKANQCLLTTDEGKIQFVCGMLDAFQEFFLKHDANPWRTLLRKRVIKSYHEVEQSIFTVFIESDVAAFFEIFRTITGRNSANESYAWFMSIMFPLSTRSYRKNKLTFSNTPLELSADFDKKFIEFCKNRLLIGWGLGEIPEKYTRGAATAENEESDK